jgi:hypothetical protein
MRIWQNEAKQESLLSVGRDKGYREFCLNLSLRGEAIRRGCGSALKANRLAFVSCAEHWGATFARFKLAR